jgi:hypothetical protein
MAGAKNFNALVHGVYASDVVLPWEDKDEFYKLLKGLKLTYQPRGAYEEEIVYDIAALLWKKRRVNRLLQIPSAESASSREIEENGVHNVHGIRRALRKKGANGKLFKSVSANIDRLSKEVSSSASKIGGQSKSSLRTQLKALQGEVAKLQPIIKRAERSDQPDKAFDFSPMLDAINKANEIEARWDGLVKKKIEQLVMSREFQRKYGAEASGMKVIDHRPAPAKAPTQVSTRKKEDKNFGGRFGDNQNDADNGDDAEDDVNDDDDNEYDWEHEYDEAMKETKKSEPK